MIFLLGELKLFCLKIILPIFLLLRSRVSVFPGHNENCW